MQRSRWWSKILFILIHLIKKISEMEDFWVLLFYKDSWNRQWEMQFKSGKTDGWVLGMCLSIADLVTCPRKLGVGNADAFLEVYLPRFDSVDGGRILSLIEGQATFERNERWLKRSVSNGSWFQISSSLRYQLLVRDPW